METKLVPEAVPYELVKWRLEVILSSIHQPIPRLPETSLVWSSVFPGLSLPLQAIRYCYAIEDVSVDDICMALTLPGLIGKETKDWEYRPDKNIILTTNGLLARRLKGQGREVSWKAFSVGLVYSEVMSELQKHSAHTLRQFTDIMKQGATFRFQRCSLREALKALSGCNEKTAVSFKNEAITCKSLRVALELVNLTGKTPTLEPRHRVHAFGHG